jgi:hypothetical protein
MFRSGSQGSETVTCIACGTELARGDAREYDKYGDRWDRAGKEFEFLCKPCYREQCHQPRRDLEDLLTEIEAGELDRDRFLEWYCALVERRSDDDPDQDHAGRE